MANSDDGNISGFQKKLESTLGKVDDASQGFLNFKGLSQSLKGVSVNEATQVENLKDPVSNFIPAGGLSSSKDSDVIALVGKQSKLKSDADTICLENEDEVFRNAFWEWNKGASQDQVCIMFKRKFLSYSPAIRLKRDLLAKKIRPVNWLNQGIGLATFQQILLSLDIYSIGAISKSVRDINEFASDGASFNVFAGSAITDSDFTLGNSGIARNQWVRHELLALKKAKVNWETSAGAMSDVSDRMLLRSLVMELRILSHTSLHKHPNIIKLFGIAWQDEFDSHGVSLSAPVLVQELAKYGNLRQYLKARQGLDADLKVRVCKGVASGLEALHRCGILHGDVKCDNVLICSEGPNNIVPKLADFGFSVLSEWGDVSQILQNKDIEIIGGTPRYMAPEVYVQWKALASAQKPVTLPLSMASRTDVYGYGLLISEIGLDGLDVFEAIVLATAEQPSELLADQEALAREKEKLVPESKLGPLSDVMLSLLITSIVKGLDERFGTLLGSVLGSFLWAGPPDDRPANFSLVEEKLRYSSETASSETRIRATRAPSNKNPPKSFALAVGHLRFLIQGAVIQVALNETGIDIHRKALIGLEPAFKYQLFKSFLLKASILVDDRALEDMTIETRASAAFCAWQVCICYLYGFGTSYDYPKALRYAVHSAKAGYLLALCRVKRLHEAFKVTCPDGLPTLQALSKDVAAGPRWGRISWSLSVRTLKQESLMEFELAWKLLNESGYSELGEALNCTKQLEGEMYTGAFVDYQYVGVGTLALALRILPITSVSDFKDAIHNGLLPAASKNYNDETLLYMCCRAGDHEKMLMLLKEFEWTQSEVTALTKEGKTVLHWITAIEIAYADEVIGELLRWGANLYAVDNQGHRAVDYAILDGNEEVALTLLDKESSCQPATPEQRNRTLGYALNCCMLKLIEHMMDTATIQEIMEATTFNFCLRPQEERMAFHGGKVSESLAKTLQLVATKLDAQGQSISFFRPLLGELMAIGAVDIFQAVLDNDIVKSLDSTNESARLLRQAAYWSQLEIFKRLLSITQPFSLEEAHRTLGVMIQYPGPSQLEIIKVLLVRLDSENLTVAVVNYCPPNWCSSSCEEQHAHKYYPSQFWSAIDEGVYEVAKLLAPHARENDGAQASTMFQVLSKASGDIFSQVLFLMRLGTHFAPLLCYPWKQANVFHTMVRSFNIYSEKSLFIKVFEFLLDEFSDGVDDTDDRGFTALHLAAALNELPTVELLVKYQADRRTKVSLQGVDGAETAYDLALRAFVTVCLKQSTEDARLNGPHHVRFRMNEKRPQETNAARVALIKSVDAVKILELLSDTDGAPISNKASYDSQRKEVVADEKWLGLRMRRTDQLSSEELKTLENISLERVPGKRIFHLIFLEDWVVDIDLGVFQPGETKQKSEDLVNMTIDLDKL
ncbi:hypothetical protein MMC15_001542 [Xylographa vitiligo]|nr:hypothetical protein [Xylographa vitiligo]